MTALLLVLFALLSCCHSQPSPPPSPPPPITPTASGVQFLLDGLSVEIAVGPSGTLRLSLSQDAAYAGGPLASPMLQPAPLPTNWTRQTEAQAAGVQVEGTTLTANLSAGGAWCLNITNTTVVGNSVLFAYNASQKQITFAQSVRDGVYYYGSGVDTDESLVIQLTQTYGDADVSDQGFRVPYFWSSQGYSIFAVSSAASLPGSPQNLPLQWNSSTNQVAFLAMSQQVDFYLAPAATLAEAMPLLWNLIGRPARIPDYALGFIVSRSGWKEYTAMVATAAQLRSEGCGVDVVVSDYEWFTPQDDSHVNGSGSDTFSDFNFNALTFPSPAANLKDIHNASLFFGGLRWGRLANSANIKNASDDGCLLTERVGSRDLNLTDQVCQDFYATKLVPSITTGIDFYWNTACATAYLTYLQIASAEQQAYAQVAATANRRPFHLANSFVPGAQTLGAAVSSGQLSSSWVNLQHTPIHMLSFTLAGAPYFTAEIGGTSAGPTTNLLIRWYQASLFSPLMRVHETQASGPRLPTAFDRSTSSLLLAIVRLRYRLLPILRSLVYNLAAGTGDGLPIVRPMVMMYPQDASFPTLGSQWLLGDNLLVAPVLTPEASRDLFIPPGVWFSFNSTAKSEGPARTTITPDLDAIPVLVKAGSVIVLGDPDVTSVDAAPLNPLLVAIYPGEDASFQLIEDDGLTATAVVTPRLTTFVWNDSQLYLKWEAQGDYTGANVYSLVQAVAYLDQGAVYTRIRNLGQSGYFNFADLSDKTVVASEGANGQVVPYKLWR